MLRQLGASVTEVRLPGDMEGLDGLVIPGGESTTISMGIESAGLETAIRTHHQAARPILATCAGMIVCDAEHLGLIDATTRRNGFAGNCSVWADAGAAIAVIASMHTVAAERSIISVSL